MGKEGLFIKNLTRGDDQILDSRAKAISKEATVHYRRMIEDYELRLEQKRCDLEASLDLSPEDSTSLILARDFNGSDFAHKDIRLSLEIFNLDLTIKEAKERYSLLFGEDYK